MATLSAPTIEELIRNVRSDLNQPDATNSFWSDEELAEYLNKGVRRYFAEVVQTMEGQFVTQTTLNLTANTDTVSLPSDFFSIKGIWKLVSGGYVPLNYRSNLNMGYSTTGETGSETYFPDYYFRGNSLVLRPPPSFSETAGLRIEYVQFPETMINGGDTLTAQVSPAFKDIIEAYALWLAKRKEALGSGNTAAMIAAKDVLNDAYTAFKEVITPRSASQTHIQPFNPEE